MKNFICMWLFLGFALTSGAQVITVLDRETGDPLELVTIASDSPSVFIMTDVRGQVNIAQLKGAQRINIRMLGYKSEYRSYESLLQNNAVLTLLPSNISLDQVVVSA